MIIRNCIKLLNELSRLEHIINEIEKKLAEKEAATKKS
jgi:hypothetical protein